MNILFSAGYLSNVPFANNNIEILLADTLANRGHKCFVLGMSQDDDVHEITCAGTVVQSWGIGKWLEKSRTVFESVIEGIPKPEIRKAIVKFIFRHPLYAFGMFILRTDLPYRNMDIRYIKKVKNLVVDEKIDAVICFCYPFDKVKLLYDADLQAKMVYYQLDPYGLHETLNTASKEQKISDEVSVISKSEVVFTTQALSRQYIKTEGYSKYSDKIIGVDFPVLSEKQVENIEIPFDFKTENTNILFCGTMDDGFRNPDYVLSTFAQVFEKDPSVKVYFLGPQQGLKVTQWAEKYPDNIFVHPGVPNNIAVAATYKADMLLNIGNAISNMVPSKIFDYFATGKPIVNVQKIDNAPDVEYFEKYPLQITLPEYSGEMQSQQLYEFIKTNKGKHLDFAQVKDLYYTATPEYVASLIENLMNNTKNIKEK